MALGYTKGLPDGAEKSLDAHVIAVFRGKECCDLHSCAMFCI